MSFDATILADSISPDDVRLTTFRITLPRFLLAELNTPRVFSRNSASSRAIPTEIQIANVRDGMFVPTTFNKRVKGMGVGNPLDEADAAAALKMWREAGMEAASFAEALNEIGIDKSRANRLLEPFLWQAVIITSTEWSNFFALRDHKDAQPEFQVIARMMREQYEVAHLNFIDYNEWHLPLVSLDEQVDYWSDHDASEPDAWLEPVAVSVRRCARVSYDAGNQVLEDWETSLEKSKQLAPVGHWSPLEHQARPIHLDDLNDHARKIMIPAGVFNAAMSAISQDEKYKIPLQWLWSGNFRGWLQNRKLYEDEHDFAQVLRKMSA